MKLKAFRIQNFRSIVDTGWQELSPDNITAIVGQNESGKTSILEALEAFASDHVTDDDIRDDDAPPIVACTFSCKREKIKDFLKNNLSKSHNFDDGLAKTIQKLKYCITFQKTWNIEALNDKPILEITDKELINYFEALEENYLYHSDMADIVSETTDEPPGTSDGAPKAIDEPSDTSDEAPRATDEPPDTSDETSKATDEPSAASDETSVPKKDLLTLDSFAKTIYKYTPLITLFKDESQLPHKIDIADLESENKEAEGYIGARNFLSLTELKIDELKSYQSNDRRIKNKIDTANQQISDDLQNFWSQFLGTKDRISIQAEIENYDQTDSSKAGQPYLAFWIKDKNGNTKPVQRSKGVRWFISFFLTLKAITQEHVNRIILIDETGANLHAKAQKDILKILESEKENMQIVYATHSPYLINVEKVYRTLVVERKDINSNSKTVTKVYKHHELGSASRDTLFPIYTAIGVDISHQLVIKETNNVILEEISAFHYFQAFWKLFNKEEEVHFLPATGCSNIPSLANLLLGWGIQFSVAVDDEGSGRRVKTELQRNRVLPEKKLIKITDCDGIEDVFEKEDFKKLILEDFAKEDSKKSILEDFEKLVLTKETKKTPNMKISGFVKNKKLPKPILAYQFLIKVEEKAIKKEHLSPKTQHKIDDLLNKIVESL